MIVYLLVILLTKGTAQELDIATFETSAKCNKALEDVEPELKKKFDVVEIKCVERIVH